MRTGETAFAPAPKLPDDPAADRPRDPTGPSLRELLKREHVAGRSTRFGRDEIVGIMRRVTHGPPVRLGLPPFDGLTLANVEAAVAAVYGWEGDGPRARIAPDCTIAGFAAACDRVLEVARDGGRVAFATARPASLLPLYRRSSRAWKPPGGDVLSADETGPLGPGAAGCVGSTGSRCSPTAPRSSATTASTPPTSCSSPCRVPTSWSPTAPTPGSGSSGLEVVAFADLDALALAVAAWQGRAVRIVPLDERRPPRRLRPLARPRSRPRRGPEPMRPSRASAAEPVAALLQHAPQGPTLTPRRSGVNGRGEPVAQSFATARFLTVQEVADLMRCRP